MGNSFRKGSTQGKQSEMVSNNMAYEAAKIFKQGEGIRTPAFAQLTNGVRHGTVGIGVTGDAQTQREELKAAQRDVLESGVSGGQARTALAQLPLDRKASRDALRSQMFNLALGSSQSATSLGMQGKAAVAANLNSLGQQRIQQNGMLTGAGAGGAAGVAGAAAAAAVFF